jgi:hypothetical protein
MAIKKKLSTAVDIESTIVEVNNKPWYEEITAPVYVAPAKIVESGVKPGHQDIIEPVYIPPDNPVVTDRIKPWFV